MISSGTNSQRARKEQEKGNGFDGDSWRDYHGDSTVYLIGKHGLYVHIADSGESNEADREQDSPDGKDSGGLESDNAGDDD